ncbi:MAG: shikimate kinase [Thermosynechococcaceae cyanobacterium MS004]|nr:shikimate kinase [Thermosynechococcaceae cyanobacterium MS004]
MMADFDLQNLNLYLIGMMGSGKSTTGKLLAQTLGYQFCDSDEVIVQATGLSIAQIFAEVGEAEFRKIETQVLSQIAAHTRLVVATGGGIVLERMNWSHLHHGLIIWLDADPDTLFSRLKEDTTRPLLQSPDPQQTLQELLAQRQQRYAQADLRIRVAAQDAPEQVVAAIVAEIPKVLRSRPTIPAPQAS